MRSPRSRDVCPSVEGRRRRGTGRRSGRKLDASRSVDPCTTPFTSIGSPPRPGGLGNANGRPKAGVHSRGHIQCPSSDAKSADAGLRARAPRRADRGGRFFAASAVLAGRRGDRRKLLRRRELARSQLRLCGPGAPAGERPPRIDRARRARKLTVADCFGRMEGAPHGGLRLHGARRSSPARRPQLDRSGAHLWVPDELGSFREHRLRVPDTGRRRQRVAQLARPSREHRKPELQDDRDRSRGNDDDVLGPELRDLDLGCGAPSASAAAPDASPATPDTAAGSASAADASTSAADPAAGSASASNSSSGPCAAAGSSTSAAGAPGRSAGARPRSEWFGDRKHLPGLDDDLLRFPLRR
jgi:hypothetical protein